MRIGGLTTLLLLALAWSGRVAVMDHSLSAYLADRMGETFPNQLPLWGRWAAALLMAFGLPMCILACDGFWQRLLLWIAASAVMWAWAPVLCLAAYQPEVVLACLATVVSGLLAMMHAAWSERRALAEISDSDEAS